MPFYRRGTTSFRHFRCGLREAGFASVDGMVPVNVANGRHCGFGCAFESRAVTSPPVRPAEAGHALRGSVLEDISRWA
jgi:hypothetical protein